MFKSGWTSVTQEGIAGCPLKDNERKDSASSNDVNGKPTSYQHGSMFSADYGNCHLFTFIGGTMFSL